MDTTYERIHSALEDLGEQLIAEIRQELATQNVNAYGNLSDSLEYTIKDNALYVWGNDYMKYAEFGRPKGRVPYDFAYIIADWATRKGVSLHGMTPVQFGWAVRHNTINYGSAKYVGTRPTNDVLQQPIDNAFNNSYEKMQLILTESVNDML